MRSKEIKKLNAQIAWCKGFTTKIEKLLNEPDNPLDQESAIIRLEQTEANFKKYNDLTLELAILTEKDSSEDFEDHDEHEERTIKVISQLRKITSKAPTTNTSSASSKAKVEDTDVTSHHGGVRLPEIDIPTYDGKDYTKYVAFIELFDAIIDSSDKLKQVQKLYYLKKYLKGEALALIEGLPLTCESYVKARELIKLRYDNKFLVINNHIQAIIDSTPIVKGTASNLRDVVANTRQHLGALKALGQPIEQWDLIVLTIILKKVDQFSCRAYHQERDSDKMPNLEDFLSFLERRASSFEESQQSEDRDLRAKKFEFPGNKMSRGAGDKV
ncbi:uncharacterized protein LOC134665278 isoform X2 [Cydia fagiglandana]|uniref:uncharacterized protein LOC134665278 isoform X2 n=1 Tax=Cydia fagiglandana TaxID=1458189 RepID=UPI002FEE45F9